VEVLQTLDAKYPADVKIQVILDHHSAHASKETQAYRATMPNRYDLVFTPTHASRSNLIERFFAKRSKKLLRGIRGDSCEELADRIQAHLDGLNTEPVPFRWRWKPRHTRNMDGI
jgi:transposase